MTKILDINNKIKHNIDYLFVDLVDVIIRFSCRMETFNDNDNYLYEKAKDYWKPSFLFGRDPFDPHHWGFQEAKLYKKEPYSNKGEDGFKDIVYFIENMSKHRNTSFYTKEQYKNGVIITIFYPHEKKYKKYYLNDVETVLDNVKFNIEKCYLEQDTAYHRYFCIEEFQEQFPKFLRNDNLPFIDKDIIDVVALFDFQPQQRVPQVLFLKSS
ncbi:MAG TPA: hypothetical protein P5136_00330 [Methanofastidiosum sp.]|nr:hypothetical protein [Methanofastidiosum sp.]